LAPGGYRLITLHRPSNVDDPLVLGPLLEVLGSIGADLPLVWPVHPRVRQVLRALDVPVGIRLVEPVGYLDFLALQRDATVVLTDSGGVQEETTILGVPCITLRDTTERPITITEGTNQLTGTDADAIHAAMRRIRAGEITRRRPALWDGKAAERISDRLVPV
jgi:UDP-N-acetylglucosamine 2-epimerase (non-hydrolysing)